MRRHDFLRGMHAVTRPRNYLEIGVNDGQSLTLSRVPSIAVDPDFRITTELRCDLRLVKATSDDFFAQPDVMSFAEGVLDLALIDGLHLFEFALRDFINVERHSAWTTAVVLDDVLPRTISEAARDRHTMEWAGDVYKIVEVLERYRPDLVCLAVDTQPTGMLVVLGLDSSNTTLSDRYDEIIQEFVNDDPQQVPETILRRRRSVDPHAALAADVWGKMLIARSASTALDPGFYDSLRELIGTGPIDGLVVPKARPWGAAAAAAQPPAVTKTASTAPKATAPKATAPKAPSVKRASRDLGRALGRSARRRVGL